MRFGSGGVELQVDLADGGRITSLRAHGREWLAASTPRGSHESFVDAGTGGWDECAPTVAACTLPDGRILRDHGDAWRQPWSASAEVYLPSVGVTLQRTLIAVETGVRLEYRATTLSREPVPLLWSAHPLFAAPPGTRLVGDGALTAEYPASRPIDWPASIDAIPGAVKAFADVQRASVVHADGVALTLRWSLPHAGFYWDSSEFTTTPIVAIEPTTGRSDSAARVWAELPTVTAGNPLAWWVSVEG